jgi:rhodanese-related sulfurtransferase
MVVMSEAKQLTVEKLLEIRANNNGVKVIEVLSEDHFKNGHIPGAINIPLDELNEETLIENKITKEDTIVVYCNNESCLKSTDAAKKLLEMGYENVFDFKAGKKGWENAGFELDVDWDYINKELENAWDYVGMGGRRRVNILAS